MRFLRTKLTSIWLWTVVMNWFFNFQQFGIYVLIHLQALNNFNQRAIIKRIPERIFLYHVHRSISMEIRRVFLFLFRYLNRDCKQTNNNKKTLKKKHHLIWILVQKLQKETEVYETPHEDINSQCDTLEKMTT